MRHRAHPHRAQQMGPRWRCRTRCRTRCRPRCRTRCRQRSTDDSAAVCPPGRPALVGISLRLARTAIQSARGPGTDCAGPAHRSQQPPRSRMCVKTALAHGHGRGDGGLHEAKNSAPGFVASLRGIAAPSTGAQRLRSAARRRYPRLSCRLKKSRRTAIVAPVTHELGGKGVLRTASIHAGYRPELQRFRHPFRHREKYCG
jgi:hypothetical protein